MIDGDPINAGKQPVTELPGAACFGQADSLAIMRGSHLDVGVIGAYRMSNDGDLADWHTCGADAIPALCGAMDLTIRAKQVSSSPDRAV